MDKLVNVSQAADMLGVSTKIMRIWDNEGKVEAVRTAGGHRRYRLSDLFKLQGIQPDKPEEKKEVTSDDTSQKQLKDVLHFADDYTIIVCLTVDTLRCWRDKGVFDLIDTIGGRSVEEILGIIGEKSGQLDEGRNNSFTRTRGEQTSA